MSLTCLIKWVRLELTYIVLYPSTQLKLDTRTLTVIPDQSYPISILRKTATIFIYYYKYST